MSKGHLPAQKLAGRWWVESNNISRSATGNNTVTTVSSASFGLLEEALDH